MNIIILHNKLGSEPTTDEVDVINQAFLVERNLNSLGHKTQTMDVGGDLYSDLQRIAQKNPDCVFNLVETVFKKSELQHIVPSILSSFRVPYTGISAEALFLTTNKTLAKKMMKQQGIKTADWFKLNELEKIDPEKQYILKPISEEGSVNLDESAVFKGNDLPRIEQIGRMDKQYYFVEEYIDGREFNVSVLPDGGQLQLLPIAEMVFDSFPQGKPQMLGYRAKWDEKSFEYLHTNRQFGTLANTPELQSLLKKMTIECANLFQLTGYARVDFRVDQQGQPFVLEVNGNPCIAADSGFMAAAKEAGLDEKTVIQKIIAQLNR